MKKVKKVLAILLTMSMMLSLMACGSKSNTEVNKTGNEGGGIQKVRQKLTRKVRLPKKQKRLPLRYGQVVPEHKWML